MPVIILVLSVVLTGLVAGLFYTYSCSVNLGLGRLDDLGYLKAMQSIYSANLNPWFIARFFGALIILPMASWLVVSQDMGSVAIHCILAASIIYAIWVFGITIFGNVLLNEALDKFDISSASDQELKYQRLTFELPQKRLNLIRALAADLSFLFSVMLLFKIHPYLKQHQ